jgi:hypothetical protein
MQNHSIQFVAVVPNLRNFMSCRIFQVLQVLGKCLEYFRLGDVVTHFADFVHVIVISVTLLNN